MAIGSVKQFILVATMSTEFVCVAQAQDWDITGNAGTSPPQNFLGTTDSAALELKVNSQRALRIEPRASPNLIGGYAGNAADSAATGATIGGGGNDGAENRVVGSYGTVAGGLTRRAVPGPRWQAVGAIPLRATTALRQGAKPKPTISGLSCGPIRGLCRTSRPRRTTSS
jgi:hypothetical protein